MGGGGRERAGLKPDPTGLGRGVIGTKEDAPIFQWERRAQRYYLLGGYCSMLTCDNQFGQPRTGLEIMTISAGGEARFQWNYVPAPAIDCSLSFLVSRTSRRLPTA